MQQPFDIAAFYAFHTIEDPARVRDEVLEAAASRDVAGVVIVAPEGLNGTVAGRDLAAFVDWLSDRFGIEPERVRWSRSEEAPFRRLSVRVKDELVPTGRLGELDESRRGTYLEPEAWDEIVRRDDVTLVDCRNTYEVELGTFDGAIDPGTDSFREFADWVDQLDPEEHPNVAMFCTGGIRCEKASAYMLQRGFAEVYHLRGGILRYLGDRGHSTETWRGECFVFDRRVSLDAALRPTDREVCWGCRMPLADGARESPLFEEGVSCPRCHDRFTDEERAAKRERHRQMS